MEFSDFTQEQQDFVTEMINTEKSKWQNEELTPLQDELVKYKPVEKTGAELALEKREQELKEKEFALILKEENLSDFAPFLEAQDEKELKNKIQDLKKLLESKKINNSYRPEQHRPADVYTKAKTSGDTKTMIKSLFNLN